MDEHGGLLALGVPGKPLRWVLPSVGSRSQGMMAASSEHGAVGEIWESTRQI